MKLYEVETDWKKYYLKKMFDRACPALVGVAQKHNSFFQTNRIAFYFFHSRHEYHQPAGLSTEALRRWAGRFVAKD